MYLGRNERQFRIFQNSDSSAEVQQENELSQLVKTNPKILRGSSIQR